MLPHRLPGLNGLRFFAALAVWVCHVEQIKSFAGVESGFNLPAVQRLGPLGVTFFFVLSGFLITHLLLREQSASGTIQVKRFYLRRALRIWPVYYLVTALTFFVFPLFPALALPPMPPIYGPDYYAKLGLFLAMCAHVSQLYFSDAIYGGALWSTSVEEHFYLIWPHVLKVARRRLPEALAAIVGALILLKALHVPGVPAPWGEVGRYFESFRIDCMAIGAFGALWFDRGELAPLFRREVQALALIALLSGVVTGTQIPWIDDDVYSILFLVVIVNVAANPRSLPRPQNPAFEFLGKISYGFYAYQWFCIAVAVKLALYFGLPRAGLAAEAVLYASAFAATTLAAWISYAQFERPFLQLKPPR